MNRDVEHIGATLTSFASRDTVSYHVHGLSSGDLTRPIMAETIRAVANPSLHEYEVEIVRKDVKRMEGPGPVDDLHYLAFGDSGLGNYLAASADAVAKIDNRALYEHVSNFYYPGDRMVIVGTGIDHASLVQFVTPLFVNPKLEVLIASLLCFLIISGRVHGNQTTGSTGPCRAYFSDSHLHNYPIHHQKSWLRSIGTSSWLSRS